MRALPRLFAVLLLTTLPPGLTAGVGVPGVQGGVVATSEAEASRAGADILRAGGNAIDAAVAVMFALSVVEPQSAGIGGGGFMMIHLADSGDTLIVDSRETAPAAASPDMFDGYPWPMTSTSGIAVGVPGAVRGAAMALDRWGTMDLSTTLQPAIRLAEEGFHVSPRLARSSESARLDNEPGHPAYEAARHVFRPNGESLSAGDHLVQEDFARSLRLLAEQGADAFYTGELAEAIIATQQHHRGDSDALAGRMTLDDLAGYAAAVREPLWGSYRGYRLATMPPPSSGGLTSLQVLGMLEQFPLGDADAGFGAGAPRSLHVMIEAMRLAFADRAVWIGDEDHVELPSAGLIHPDYLAQRAALIDPDMRLPDADAGDPRPYANTPSSEPPHIASGRVADTESVSTTHFSIVDRHGNVVSYTNTIEAPWGTGLMVPGYGFLLNNELTDFNARPRRSDAGAPHDPGANDAAPGKRPRSSMAPTMLFRDEQAVAAYGAPGGATIINTVVNVTINLVDHGFDAQEAADAPRLSQTSADGRTIWEAGIPRESRDALVSLGHTLAETPTEIGAAQIVVIDPESGLQYGGADRRRIGSVQSIRADTIDTSR